MIRKMLTSFFAITIPMAGSAETLEYPGLSDQQLDAVLLAMRDDRVLSIAPSWNFKVVGPDVSGMWAGSRTSVDLEKSDLTLTFGKDGGAAQNDIESFDFSVGIARHLMKIKHSAPKNPKAYLGFTLRTDTRNVNRTRRPYIAGRGETGLLFVVPQFHSTENDWAVMACPMTVKTIETKLDRGLRRLSYTLVPSPYRLTKVAMTMAGSASAQMTTVGQNGFSEITFFSSPQVPKSLETNDAVLANDPRPRVEYRPDGEFKPFVVPESGTLAEGMIFSVLMQNQAGFFRKQIFSSGIFVRKVSETFDQIVADEKLFNNVTATCYVFGPRREVASDYGKSAFAGAVAAPREGEAPAEP